MKKKRALLLALMIMGFITSLGLCIFCIFAIHWPGVASAILIIDKIEQYVHCTDASF